MLFRPSDRIFRFPKQDKDFIKNKYIRWIKYDLAIKIPSNNYTVKLLCKVQDERNVLPETPDKTANFKVKKL